MNGTRNKDYDPYRSFLLMEEIAKEEPLSQRELASRLGIALGLVNSYLKNLVAKGYVRISSFPRNRYAYLLTPQGLAEKSRLAYQHLNYFTNLYRIARHDYLELFRALESAGIRKVIFCGVDEVAEIAYLSLRETGIELVAVMDDGCAGEVFFGQPVVSLERGLLLGRHKVVIASLKRGEALREELLRLGVAGEDIILVSRERKPGES
ncbi:MAG: winged helix-turn-helix transcriptional regulator [Geobacter sp.]|nr:winged helix-turn-helix transcriptional regulator [Geobacter sp.]